MRNKLPIAVKERLTLYKGKSHWFVKRKIFGSLMLTVTVLAVGVSLPDKASAAVTEMGPTTETTTADTTAETPKAEADGTSTQGSTDTGDTTVAAGTQSEPSVPIETTQGTDEAASAVNTAANQGNTTATAAAETPFASSDNQSTNAVSLPQTENVSKDNADATATPLQSGQSVDVSEPVAVTGATDTASHFSTVGSATAQQTDGVDNGTFTLVNTGETSTAGSAIFQNDMDMRQGWSVSGSFEFQGAAWGDGLGGWSVNDGVGIIISGATKEVLTSGGTGGAFGIGGIPNSVVVALDTSLNENDSGTPDSSDLYTQKDNFIGTYGENGAEVSDKTSLPSQHGIVYKGYANQQSRYFLNPDKLSNVQATEGGSAADISTRNQAFLKFVSTDETGNNVENSGVTAYSPSSATGSTTAAAGERYALSWTPDVDQSANAGTNKVSGTLTVTWYGNSKYGDGTGNSTDGQPDGFTISNNFVLDQNATFGIISSNGDKTATVTAKIDQFTVVPNTQTVNVAYQFLAEDGTVQNLQVADTTVTANIGDTLAFNGDTANSDVGFTLPDFADYQLQSLSTNGTTDNTLTVNRDANLNNVVITYQALPADTSQADKNAGALAGTTAGLNGESAADNTAATTNYADAYAKAYADAAAAQAAYEKTIQDRKAGAVAGTTDGLGGAESADTSTQTPAYQAGYAKAYADAAAAKTNYDNQMKQDQNEGAIEGTTAGLNGLAPADNTGTSAHYSDAYTKAYEDAAAAQLSYDNQMKQDQNEGAIEGTTAGLNGLAPADNTGTSMHYSDAYTKAYEDAAAAQLSYDNQMKQDQNEGAIEGTTAGLNGLAPADNTGTSLHYSDAYTKAYEDAAAAQLSYENQMKQDQNEGAIEGTTAGLNGLAPADNTGTSAHYSDAYTKAYEDAAAAKTAFDQNIADRKAGAIAGTTDGLNGTESVDTSAETPAYQAGYAKAYEDATAAKTAFDQTIADRKAGAVAGTTDGLNGAESADTSTETPAYQAGYAKAYEDAAAAKTAFDQTIADRKAGAIAGTTDGLNGAESADTSTETPAYQAGYTKAYDDAAAAKLNYDNQMKQDQNIGAIEGTTAGINALAPADNSEASAHYSDAYTNAYEDATAAKAAYDQTIEDRKAGAVAGTTDGLNGAESADTSTETPAYQAGYAKAYEDATAAKDAYDQTIADRKAGAVAGTTDGLNGAESADTSAETPAYQAGYAQAYEDATAAKAAYDQTIADRKAGAVAGTTDGLNGAESADTSAETPAYQAGYAKAYEDAAAAKLSYDNQMKQDQNAGAIEGTTAGLNGLAPADTTGTTTHYSDAYTKAYEDAALAKTALGKQVQQAKNAGALAGTADGLDGADKADVRSKTPAYQAAYAKAYEDAAAAKAAYDQRVQHDKNEGAIAGTLAGLSGEAPDDISGQSPVYQAAYQRAYGDAQEVKAILDKYHQSQLDQTDPTKDPTQSTEPISGTVQAPVIDTAVVGQTDNNTSDSAGDVLQTADTSTAIEENLLGSAQSTNDAQPIPTQTSPGVETTDSDYAEVPAGQLTQWTTQNSKQRTSVNSENPRPKTTAGLASEKPLTGQDGLTATTLPQTGEQSEAKAGLLGILSAVLAVFGLGTLNRKKRSI